MPSDLLQKPATDKVVVLDLDSTLIATQDHLEDYNSMPFKNQCYTINVKELTNGKFSRQDMWGIKRPYLDDYLLFCFNYYRLVIVWSAGTKPYVEAIVATIFKNLRPPHLIWTKDDIEMDNDNILKPLSKLIQKNPHLKLSLDKIMVVDDNESTFQHNLPNAIHIPPFEPTVNALLPDDDALLKIKNWCLLPQVMKNPVHKLDMNIFN